MHGSTTPAAAVTKNLSCASLRVVLKKLNNRRSHDQRSGGYHPTLGEVVDWENIPFSPETLARHSATHLLIPTPPLSICDLRQSAWEIFFPRLPEPAWYEAEEWAHQPLPRGWALVAKEPARCELAASANLIVFAILCYYWHTGESLYGRRSVYTADTVGKGSTTKPVSVRFTAGRLTLHAD